MREAAEYAFDDGARIRELIEQNPWATLVSATPTGVVVSHYPFLVEEDDGGLVLLSHVGRPDERAHRLGSTEVAVVFAGPSGYVSPSWYGISPAVPTWNFAVVHAYGVPEILSDGDNLDVLGRLVDHFEERLPDPVRMRGTFENSAYADRIVHGTVGFRMRVTRIQAKDKMSQDKPAEVVDRIVAALRRPGPYQNPRLAARMAGVHRLDR
ncbi:FMN-binding negative transcriptional regulator [Frigoribacterium sp. 2-23]|uniref:FMN-binding negative transcriptional regulator n=1 Tax=Frigoribacterium sp. 2-23 TaxID=3415006 RepID=UPI003C6FD181